MLTSSRRKGWFVWFAKGASHWTGSPFAFLLAVATIIIWLVTGPVFGFSDTWQLIINTGTTIITFLMVFLIQNTQNRDSRAMQLKLDELIRCTQGAHTVLLDLEELSDKELEAIYKKYNHIAQVARERLRAGKDDTDVPEVVLNQPLQSESLVTEE